MGERAAEIRKILIAAFGRKVNAFLQSADENGLARAEMMMNDVKQGFKVAAIQAKAFGFSDEVHELVRHRKQVMITLAFFDVLDLTNEELGRKDL